MEYEILIGPRLDPGPKDAEEGRVLNRIIKWSAKGIEFEADPRQERLVLERGLEGSQSMGTQGVRPTAAEFEADQEVPTKPKNQVSNSN